MAFSQAIKEAAFAAGDAAAARTIADIADWGVADELLWKRVFADTEAANLLPVLQKEQLAWAGFFADLRERNAREALESLKQQAATWAALDSPSIRQAAAVLADRAGRISADGRLDATIRTAAAGALAEAARILEAALGSAQN
jgi:hypothetical protein